MKLLVDCTPLSSGGGVQVAIALLVNLRAQTDIVWQAVLKDQLRVAVGPELAADPRMIYVRNTSRLTLMSLSGQLGSIERAFDPDVVFTVFGAAYFRARAPHVMGFALPHLIYPPDCPQTQRGRREAMADHVRSRLLRRATWIAVETETVRRRLAERLAIPSERISVIGNSVNPVLLTCRAAGIPETGRFGILVPSAYYKHKNLEIIPQVAAELQRLDPELDFEFRLTLGPATQAWQAMAADAQKLGVADRLKTLGIVPIRDLGEQYIAASAVFLPTLREASTAVYPESFHFGRPLVTSDLDFARELCGDAAVFVPPRDPKFIANRLAALARSPHMRDELVAAGRLQLAHGYPKSGEKFRQQVAMLTHVASLGQPARAGSALEGKKTAAQFGLRKRPAEGNAIDFHDDIADTWDEKYQSGGFARRARWFSKNVLPRLQGQGPWLDVGCGTGYFSRLLSDRGFPVTGVDASRAMIERATAIAQSAPLNDKLDFQLIETAERLPFGDNSMAGCVCLSVLEYLDRPGDCLDEVARIIRPGGMLVLSVPNRYSPLRGLQKIAGQLSGKASSLTIKYRALSKYDLTRSELRDALARRGFSDVKILGFDRLLPDMALAAVAPGLMYAVAVKAPLKSGAAVSQPLEAVTAETGDI